MKRLFFAAEIAAPWPQDLPKGRYIAEEFRHMTIAFLGLVDSRNLLNLMNQVPLPKWRIGPAGIFNRYTFLPEKSPRVVAACPAFAQGEEAVINYQKELSQWLFDHNFLKTIEHFLPHVSISRDPFDENGWRSFSCKIPFFIRGIALFSSLGSSRYELLWEKKSQPPFEEIEHTADIAYQICGENFSQLAIHATIALAFSFPSFSRYIGASPYCSSIEDVIYLLNERVAQIDIEEGIGLKAVSYHANVEERGNELLYWTMIVDV